jgi:aspartyl protease family protein
MGLNSPHHRFCSRFALVGAALLGGCSGGDSPEASAPPQAASLTAAASQSTEEPDRQASSEPGQGVSLNREADGHFYVEAEVNGAPVRLMVDTGATSVALTPADAEALGFSFGEDEYTGVGKGVGGDVALKAIKLDSLSVGSIVHRDVDAVIVNSELQVSLLGQSWLSRVGTVSIQGNRMTFR